jgi:hypothetical protein
MTFGVAVFGALILSAAQPEAALPAVRPSAITDFISAERLLLPSLRRPATVTVDPLGATIELRVPNAAQMALRLRPLLGTICPIVESRLDVVRLHCRTRHLDAELTIAGGRSFLDIRELRGLPYRGPEQQLQSAYDPARFSAADGCPGGTPAARGECAMAAGRPNEAALQFRLAIGTAQHAWGAVRLGDLAVSSGDISGALKLYQRAGTSGPFGRLALLRTCELTGACLEDPRAFAFSTVALPEPIATEVALRAARADTFEGRVGVAIGRLGAVLAAEESQPFCDQIGMLFCRRLVLDLLERSDAESGHRAIELYLALPRRLEGPMILELARAAAEKSAALGAPIFAGNIMTSVFSAVEPEGMRDYLLRTAELYVMGHDWARAHLVLEYAESRLVGRQISDVKWMALRAGLKNEDREARRVTPDEAHRFDDLAGLVAHDLAAALTTMERARAIAH